LRHRLIELINLLSSEARELIFGDEKSQKKFIQKLVNTRNYLTLYDQKGSSGIIESEKRILAIQRLKAFMTILIFKELGMKEEEIIKRFKEDYRMNFQLSKANMEFE
ncbi:HEPN domain-containing protein, partial [Pseudomonas sihuiensis]